MFGLRSSHGVPLDWLARNQRYTARYALHVGALCRKMTVKDVVLSERLHYGTVKDLDKLYMAEQLRRHPMPATTAIGVDEIAIRKGHEYTSTGSWSATSTSLPSVAGRCAIQPRSAG
ncbi:MAG: helix-turn-helix domain-containing protein [Gammaproteobacteria bacterium]